MFDVAFVGHDRCVAIDRLELITQAQAFTHAHPEHATAVARWLAWSLPRTDVDPFRPDPRAIMTFCLQTGTDERGGLAVAIMASPRRPGPRRLPIRPIVADLGAPPARPAGSVRRAEDQLPARARGRHRPGGRCPACQGRGVTGEQFIMNAGDSVQILVDLLCLVCGGCGQAAHDTCAPSRHIDWDPADDEDTDYWDQERCPSCQGRTWNANQAFTRPDDPDETDEVYLRAPCGCAGQDMVNIEFVEDAVPDDVMSALTAAMATTQLVAAVRAAASTPRRAAMSTASCGP
ncbi:hypothetical protein [Catellatospora sp. NPDC049609]|uniref:hypothetical protein n=1 Tax=Catellatospora sp. NPDC049609 TaxID=3155505 RepID=UPI003425DD54